MPNGFLLKFYILFELTAIECQIYILICVQSSIMTILRFNGKTDTLFLRSDISNIPGYGIVMNIHTFSRRGFYHFKHIRIDHVCHNSVGSSIDGRLNGLANLRQNICQSSSTIAIRSCCIKIFIFFFI